MFMAHNLKAILKCLPNPVKQLYYKKLESVREAERQVVHEKYEHVKQSLMNDILGNRGCILNQSLIETLGLTPNQKAILALKDLHKGKRCFVIATGPSLRVEDLDMLKNEICFGCNKIFLAFDRTEWRPTYYTVLDVLVAEQNLNIIRNLSTQKIFPTSVFNQFKDDIDITWLNCTQYKEPCFSENLLKEIVGGYTVIYTQLQMAFFMGFTEVILLGLDFSFKQPNITHGVCEHGPILIGQGEVNHFDSRYRPEGEKWTMPRLDEQYVHFRCAREHFERDGRQIINASRQSALDVFERLPFERVI